MEESKGKPEMRLGDGSRVAVVGGGPAGSFFSYFLLQIAQRLNLKIGLDLYESRDFSTAGPTGCNMCAGVISESLVQELAVEGILLPDGVVQRGITSYVMHSETETVTIGTPLEEMRIATVHRGGGPRGGAQTRWKSFDGYLQKLAIDKGANLIHGRVTGLTRNGDRPQVQVKETKPQTYDLVVGAIGVNSPSLTLFEDLGIAYRRPRVRKLFLTEIPMEFDAISTELGGAMHVFLLEMPKVDFAALVPKGDYVTVVLIGEDIDRDVIASFSSHPVVQRCFSDSKAIETALCRCSPQAAVGDAVNPYGDRVVLIGDCGISRLNKDGIGSAYRTAKAAAVAAVFEGVSAADFHRYYWPVCRQISRDNSYGTLIFTMVNLMKKFPFSVRGVMRMARVENSNGRSTRRMSMVLWDVFTGSAPYRNVFMRTLRPAFLGRFLLDMVASLRPPAESTNGSNREEIHERV